MATFSDDFNRADGALGSNWAQAAAQEIISNEVGRATAANSAARWVTDANTDAEFSQVTYTATAAGVSVFVGPAIRMATFVSGSPSAQGEWFVLFVSGTTMNTVSIRRKDNLVGTSTTLATATFTVALGDVLRLEVDGADLVGKINGTERIRHASYTPLTNGGRGTGFHFGSSNIAPRFDNWSGGDTAAPTVPGTVTNLAGTAGNAQVPLTWTAPADGGSAISDYIVQFRPS
ncbi:MAG: hypothetical protein ABIO83_11160 [Ilumatobacteraceae bacterium]